MTVEGMFYNAASLDLDLSQWNVAQVENLHHMFEGATSFSQNPCSWGSLLIKNVSVTLMFDGAMNCPLQASPNVLATPHGQFCYFSN